MEIRFFPYLFIRSCTHPIEWMDGLRCPKTIAKLREYYAAEEKLEKCAIELDSYFQTEIPNFTPETRRSAIEIKRYLKKKNYGEPGAKIVQNRAALLDASDVTDVQKKNLQVYEKIRADLPRLLKEAENVFSAEFDEVRTHLASLLRDPNVKEGILISSRSLYDGVKRYMARPPAKGDKGDKGQRQLERNVMEHLARASAKTTPRGLLTGVTVGHWGKETAVQEPAPTFFLKRKTMLTLTTAREIAKKVSSSGERWKDVVPRPNPTWYKREGKVCFWKRPEGAGRDKLYSLPEHELVDAFLAAAHPRKLKARELVAAVTRQVSAEESEVLESYRKLCASGLLIGHLEIPFEILDALPFIIAWLEKLPAEHEPAADLKRLKRVRELLLSLDGELEFGAREKAYQEISELLEEKEISKILVSDCMPNLPGATVSERIKKNLAATVKNFGELHSAPIHFFHIDKSYFEKCGRVPFPEVYDDAMANQLPISKEKEPLKRRGLSELKEGEFAKPLKGNPVMWGGLTFKAGPGDEAELRGSLLQTLTRYVELFGKDSELADYYKRQSEIRHAAFPGIELAEMIASPPSKLSFAAWFQRNEPYAIEFTGVPSIRGAEGVIPFREIEMGIGPNGEHRAFWKEREILFTKDHGLTTMPIEDMLPMPRPRNSLQFFGLDKIREENTKTTDDGEFSPRSGQNGIFRPSRWRFPIPTEIKEGMGVWELFVVIQREKYKRSFPSWVKPCIELPGRWDELEMMVIDVDNPILVEAFVSDMLVLGKRVEYGKRFQFEELVTDGRGLQYEFVAPYVILE